MIEVISVIVSIIFGILTIVTVYPKGRKWLADKYMAVVAKGTDGVKIIRLASRSIIRAGRTIFTSPFFYIITSALIIWISAYTITTVNSPTEVFNIILSASSVDGIISLSFGLVLLVIIWTGFRKTKLIPENYQLVKRDEFNELTKKAERYSALSSLISEKEVKIKSLELEIVELQSAQAQQEKSQDEDVTHEALKMNVSYLFEALSDFLQPIPDEIKQKPAKLEIGSLLVPLSDKQARVDLRTDYGTGDAEFSKLLKMVKGLGTDIKIFGRLNTLVLVRDQVFAIFAQSTTDILESLASNFKPNPVQAYLHIHKCKLLDEISKRYGAIAFVHPDSKLPLEIRNIWELEDNEIKMILLEAYQSA